MATPIAVSWSSASRVLPTVRDLPSSGYGRARALTRELVIWDELVTWPPTVRDLLQDLVFRVQGLGCSVWAVGFMVGGVRASGVGCRVDGSGVRNLTAPREKERKGGRGRMGEGERERKRV